MIDNQNEMTVPQLIRAALKENGWQLKDFAAKVGKTPGALSAQLNSGSMSAEEWRRMASLAGFEVVMRRVDTSPRLRTGIAPRTHRVINGEVYDTARADAVCHRGDGIGWYSELYRRDDGRYFLIHAHERLEVIPSLVPITDTLADQFEQSCLQEGESQCT